MARDIKSDRRLTVMEVCGSHTETISKYGIRKLYQNKVNLISGPGCPVCVISKEDIDEVLGYLTGDFIIATFGDLIRVLRTQKGLTLVYSPLEALKLAEENPQKPVIFIGIGFETTAPLVAQTIILAQRYLIKNFAVLCLHKTMPAVLEYLLVKGSDIDGFILPGHVCTIIGSKPFEFIAKGFGKTAVISGFEPEDVVESIEKIIKAVRCPSLTIQYKRAVHPEGNIEAKKVLNRVFKSSDSNWQGIGIIKGSGLAIRSEWEFFDARKRWGHLLNRKTNTNLSSNARGCRCDDIIKGLLTPLECPLFQTYCTLNNPLGSCMASLEGACAVYYRYRG